MSSNWRALQSKLGGGGGGSAHAGGGRGKGGGKGGAGKGGAGKGGAGKGSGQRKEHRAPSADAGPHKKPRVQQSASPARTSAPAPLFEGSAAVPALLEPGHAEFDACLRRCYRGFVHEPATLPAPLQQRVESALLQMNSEGYFHHDIVLGATKGGTAYAAVPFPTHASASSQR
jgi:hypothetical protein